MDALEANAIAKKKLILNSSDYEVVKKIIRSQAEQGKFSASMSMGSMNIAVANQLQTEGYTVRYVSNNCVISW